MFPLALFPTVADNLESMDSRKSLRHLNTFMKNTLIRGFNRVHELAPLINASHPNFHTFLEYTQLVCDMTSLHLEGDETFFASSNAHGKALRDYLGDACSPSNAEVYRSMKQLRQTMSTWANSPQTYSCVTLRDGLRFGALLVGIMKTQLEAIKDDRIAAFVSDEALRSMIRDHMEWLSSHSDISVLLPFVISHHDPKTSVYWPTVTAQGLAALPDLVNVHPGCWKFAPLDPVSRAIQAATL